MIAPAHVIPPALMARLVALEARMAPLEPAMAAEAARVAAIRAQVGAGQRPTQADADLLLRTAGTDFERQYWASLLAVAV